jgi:hypothetical protein
MNEAYRGLALFVPIMTAEAFLVWFLWNFIKAARKRH